MDFGKLTDISTVDFELAPENERTNEVLGGIETHDLAIYVGCPVWGVDAWVGQLYPKGTKANDYLYHYSRQFNTIELNATHYRTPNDATLLRWKSDAANDFLFCPKIAQDISHHKTLQIGTDKMQFFCNQMEKLQSHLGCMFMQLSPYFGKSSLPILVEFLSVFPSHLKLAIEFRHESWFENRQLIEIARDVLESFDVATVITDVAGRRDVSHNSLTNATAMVRFVGNELHQTDYERIDEWLKRIESWKKQGLKTLYFFLHEPDNTDAPTIADYFITQLNQKLKISHKRPHFSKDELTLF